MVAETHGNEVEIAPRKKDLGKRISDIIRRKRPMHQVLIKSGKKNKKYFGNRPQKEDAPKHQRRNRKGRRSRTENKQQNQMKGKVAVQ